MQRAHVKKEGETHFLSRQIWDSSGSRRGVYAPTSLRGPDALLYVFDLTKAETFDDLNFWVQGAGNKYMNPKPVSFIVGNKCDDADRRVVDSKVATDHCEKLGIPYSEVSAKTAEGLDDLFANIARAALIAEGVKPAELGNPKGADPHSAIEPV